MCTCVYANSLLNGKYLGALSINNFNVLLSDVLSLLLNAPNRENKKTESQTEP